MNQTYILRSTKFTGSVLYTFSPEGLLLKYDTENANLSNEQLQWIATRMPRNLLEFKNALSASKTYQLELQKTGDVSFDMFWDRYNEKARSSKKKTLKIWERLPQAQRNLAYQHISAYLRTMPAGVGKKYAETYLHAELWNN